MPTNRDLQPSKKLLNFLLKGANLAVEKLGDSATADSPSHEAIPNKEPIRVEFAGPPCALYQF